MQSHVSHSLSSTADRIRASLGKARLVMDRPLWASRTALARSNNSVRLSDQAMHSVTSKTLVIITNRWVPEEDYVFTAVKAFIHHNLDLNQQELQIEYSYAMQLRRNMSMNEEAGKPHWKGCIYINSSGADAC